MNGIDSVFSEEQYKKMREAYDKVLTPLNFSHISKLKQVLNQIQQHPFYMTPALRKAICNKLDCAIQILSILSQQEDNTNLQITSPFSIIYELSSIIKDLSSHSLDSPCKKICQKASFCLLEIINMISAHLANKTIKIYKYI